MSHILITGSNGQMGASIYRLSQHYPDLTFIFADRSMLDVTAEESIRSFFKRHRVDACINCAAYTAVDQAESETGPAHKVNALAAQMLAEKCKELHLPMIHYSSDYVYHSEINRPYKEEDMTFPQSVYAHTKLAGDKAIIAEHEDAIILRTSWVYSPFGKNFVKTMIRLGQERDTINVVYDQVGTPTYAPDLAKVSLDIMVKLLDEEQAHNMEGGIYHYSNEGVCSWYDFAKAIFEETGIDCTVVPIESKDFPTPAKRPNFSVLNKSKIKKRMPIQIPYWRDSLKQCIATLQNTVQ